MPYSDLGQHYAIWLLADASHHAVDAEKLDLGKVTLASQSWLSLSGISYAPQRLVTERVRLGCYSRVAGAEKAHSVASPRVGSMPTLSL
jgi:hypothetical protein